MVNVSHLYRLYYNHHSSFVSPPPPQFYCFTTTAATTTILLFSPPPPPLPRFYSFHRHRHHRHNSFVSPQPPPPQLCCFHHQMKDCAQLALAHFITMSRVVMNNRGFLQLLADCSPEQRQFLIVTATPQQMHALVQVILNVLHINLPYSEEEEAQIDSK